MFANIPLHRYKRHCHCIPRYVEINTHRREHKNRSLQRAHSCTVSHTQCILGGTDASEKYLRACRMCHRCAERTVIWKKMKLAVWSSLLFRCRYVCCQLSIQYNENDTDRVHCLFGAFVIFSLPTVFIRTA